MTTSVALGGSQCTAAASSTQGLLNRAKLCLKHDLSAEPEPVDKLSSRVNGSEQAHLAQEK